MNYERHYPYQSMAFEHLKKHFRYILKFMLCWNKLNVAKQNNNTVKHAYKEVPGTGNLTSL